MVSAYVDTAVSQAKFSREVAEYRSLESQYRSRGWFLLEARFPSILVVLAAPQLSPPAIVTGVLFDYSNYDAEPPSVRLVNPFSGEPYRAKDLPTTLNRSVGVNQQVAIPGLPAGAIRINQLQPLMVAYGPDEVPFMCIAGVKEYHDHPAHSGDSWELHRHNGAGRLVRLLEVIHKYGIAPISRYAVQMQPNVTGFDLTEIPA
jgi:hypothetical protein